MKKISNYIPSVILSVLLIISLIGTSLAFTVFIRLDPDKTISFAEDEKLYEKSYAAIEKYYKEKAGSTGIPAEVFMNSITDDYVKKVVDSQIEATYRVFESGRNYSAANIPNPELEASIDDFFNDYADKTGYTKDEKFEKKLSETKQQAYKTINNSCDVFKIESMQSHGLLSKISKLYRRKSTITAVFIILDVVLVGLLLLVNIRRRDFFYWTGISAVISALIALIPSVRLVRTKYFDSFTIKQPQVFAAYTKTLYSLTNTFIRMQIFILLAGAVMIGLYALFCRIFRDKAKKPSPENGKMPEQILTNR